MSERTKRMTERGERVGRAENKRGVIFGWPVCETGKGEWQRKGVFK